MVDGVREKSYFRNWWMTTGAVPDASPQVRKTGFLTASLAIPISSMIAAISSFSSLTGT
jgi:hypothetical protein